MGASGAAVRAARPAYLGDRARIIGDDLHPEEGVVEAVETWRDGVAAMRAAEAQEFTARIDGRMRLHGGRARWARLAVRLESGRILTVEAPQFVIVESRAAIDHRGKQLRADDDQKFNDDTAAAGARGATGDRG
jgi:hypothetical protein